MLEGNNNTSSNDHANPWESAANDRVYQEENDGDEEAAAALTTTTMRLSSTTSPTNTTLPDPQQSCAFRTFQTCHLWDILLSMITFLYVTLDLQQKSSSSPQKPYTQAWTILLCVLASIWMTRGILAKVTQCGVFVSAQMSAALAIVYGIVLLPVGYWMVHFETQYILWNWAKEHPHWFVMLLVIATIMEATRWIWIRNWWLRELEEQEEEARASRSRRNLRRSPWWWRDNSNNNNHEDSMQDPLLQTDGGRPPWTSTESSTRNTTTSWLWPFGQRRGRPSRNPRDDGSVDYASLSEDWAGRSQDDPLWWSREEDEGGAQRGL